MDATTITGADRVEHRIFGTNATTVKASGSGHRGGPRAPGSRTARTSATLEIRARHVAQPGCSVGLHQNGLSPDAGTTADPGGTICVS